MEASEDKRTRAIKNLKAKQSFRRQLITFVGVSILFVAIWAFSGQGFFWPVFPIAAWGLFGILPQGWSLYHGDGITEDKIQEEMNRLGDDPS